MGSNVVWISLESVDSSVASADSSANLKSLRATFVDCDGYIVVNPIQGRRTACVIPDVFLNSSWKFSLFIEVFRDRA